jgi:hypothetical protein
MNHSSLSEDHRKKSVRFRRYVYVRYIPSRQEPQHEIPMNDPVGFMLSDEYDDLHSSRSSHSFRLSHSSHSSHPCAKKLQGTDSDTYTGVPCAATSSSKSTCLPLHNQSDLESKSTRSSDVGSYPTLATTIRPFSQVSFSQRNYTEIASEFPRTDLLSLVPARPTIRSNDLRTSFVGSPAFDTFDTASLPPRLSFDVEVSKSLCHSDSSFERSISIRSGSPTLVAQPSLDLTWRISASYPDPVGDPYRVSCIQKQQVCKKEFPDRKTEYNYRMKMTESCIVS